MGEGREALRRDVFQHNESDRPPIRWEAARSCPSLIAFLLLVFGANALLMLDRFAVLESIARASGIALLMGAGVYVLAIWNARQRRRKAAEAAAPIVTAADRPAAPPGPAP